MPAAPTVTRERLYQSLHWKWKVKKRAADDDDEATATEDDTGLTTLEKTSKKKRNQHKYSHPLSYDTPNFDSQF